MEDEALRRSRPTKLLGENSGRDHYRSDLVLGLQKWRQNLFSEKPVRQLQDPVLLLPDFMSIF